MLYVFSATYMAVLLAELIGDKSMYVAASLTNRYRPLFVYLGICIAFAMKAGAAVLFGGWLGHVPTRWLAAVSVLTFLFSAIAIGFTKPKAMSATTATLSSSLAVPFASVFFTEWADIGQLTTAAVVARFGLPWVVWAAATAALMTKGLLGVTVGARVGRHLPAGLWRLLGAGMCLVFSLISLRDLIHR
jgi:putative Ca2+/H+ antiporter (TMEM165/GDT1 family)